VPVATIPFPDKPDRIVNFNLGTRMLTVLDIYQLADQEYYSLLNFLSNFDFSFNFLFPCVGCLTPGDFLVRNSAL
jgi:hypothetical protein